MHVCDDGGDDDNKDQSSPIKTAPMLYLSFTKAYCSALLELRLPIEYAAVIQGVFQDLCTVGN